MTEIILLGRREFEARPPKLGQLRRLLDALDSMAGKSGGALLEAAADIVVAGLAPAHPDLSRDAVLDLEATLDELNAAVAAILRIAGLRSAGEAQPVAGPGDIPGNSSAPSTALSPPAAAVPIE
ncbi:MAG TPA: hypothetical protein VGQ90_08140 [Stellaceae bacterium]|nr:hypothetical protein [Stellaceae bacterium]